MRARETVHAVSWRLVTVAQFTEIVGKASRVHNGEAAYEIEHLQLTERLSNSKLAMPIAKFAGE